MDSIHLLETMTVSAKRAVASGETSKDYLRRATEQERDGFSVSADYTRLFASIMKAIEDKS